MKFEQEPHPLIEDHYHIRELINAQEKRAADRDYHRFRHKVENDRITEINSTDIKVTTEFWCETCKQDFKGEALRQVEVDWTNPRQTIAFYRTKCFKGHWCMRHITDKLIDPYFEQSRAVARQRGEHFADTLQPFQNGFNMVYGKK